MFTPPPKKKLTTVIAILCIFSFSCTKMDMTSQTSRELVSNVVPNVPQCNPGYHWDFYLGKCVPVCSTGYHNDSITGACVVDGGTPPIIITYAGVNISYYATNHILSFNNSNDVNTVLNQLDSDYENYNTAYENQYPNFSDIQLDSLDSVRNFDQFQTYRTFEAKFAGYSSERAKIENIETIWINNNFAGSDPDNIDYTFDNSFNSICNNGYQLIVAGNTYQWTSTGLVLTGGNVSSPTYIGCFTNRKALADFTTSNQSRKCRIKAAVNYSIIRGEGKGKVVSFRKKSNGRWTRSRLNLAVSTAGNLYTSANCTGLQKVSLRNPVSGYKKRRELKVIARTSGPTYTQSGQYTSSFISPILSGSVTIQ